MRFSFLRLSGKSLEDALSLWSGRRVDLILSSLQVFSVLVVREWLHVFVVHVLAHLRLDETLGQVRILWSLSRVKDNVVELGTELIHLVGNSLSLLDRNGFAIHESLNASQDAGLDGVWSDT